MSQTIAIIPAKSNSRRLPGKNMRQLAGKPLFVHSVDVAMQCEKIDHVVVSSDSDEILDIAESLGVTCHKRPVELCADNVPNYVVCQHVVDELQSQGVTVDTLILLQPTHPFRDSSMVDDALGIFESNNTFDSLVSVVRLHRAVGVVTADGEWHGRGGFQSVRAQNDEKLYTISGHIFILRVNRTLRKETLFGEKVYGWNLPESWKDIDIDTFDDFQFAECVAAEYL